jgi:hypothetical protein
MFNVKKEKHPCETFDCVDFEGNPILGPCYGDEDVRVFNEVIKDFSVSYIPGL